LRAAAGSSWRAAFAMIAWLSEVKMGVVSADFGFTEDQERALLGGYGH